MESQVYKGPGVPIVVNGGGECTCIFYARRDLSSHRLEKVHGCFMGSL